MSMTCGRVQLAFEQTDRQRHPLETLFGCLLIDRHGQTTGLHFAHRFIEHMVGGDLDLVAEYYLSDTSRRPGHHVVGDEQQPDLRVALKICLVTA